MNCLALISWTFSNFINSFQSHRHYNLINTFSNLMNTFKNLVHSLSLVSWKLPITIVFEAIIQNGDYHSTPGFGFIIYTSFIFVRHCLVLIFFLCFVFTSNGDHIPELNTGWLMKSIRHVHLRLLHDNDHNDGWSPTLIRRSIRLTIPGNKDFKIPRCSTD